ncbi:uncharacterized protein LOC122264025 [Penaeus japonicus]|uniref:uncharacterized protein LOC122264025 n=1 Tax=Penaeus japonicus TaxID=27405 RepID=UPI001C71050A|nr:uncharacterized protein LOC122264025 [Penaeus japonicus]
MKTPKVMTHAMLQKAGRGDIYISEETLDFRQSHFRRIEENIDLLRLLREIEVMFFKIIVFICLVIYVAVCNGGPLARAIDLGDMAPEGASLTRLTKRSPRFGGRSNGLPCRGFGVARCDPDLPLVLCRPYAFPPCQDTEFLEVSIK